jgi:hypothetical protein
MRMRSFKLKLFPQLLIQVVERWISAAGDSKCSCDRNEAQERRSCGPLVVQTT